MGRGDAGTRGRGDAGTRGRGDRGTRGRGDARTRYSGTWGRRDSGTWDARTLELGDVARRAGTRGRDKQTTPNFRTEFEKYNLWRSSVR